MSPSPRDPRNQPQHMDPPPRSGRVKLARLARAGRRLVQAGVHLWREATRCPVCGSRNLELVQVGDRPCRYACGRCRLLFVDPRPSGADLVRHYSGDRRVPGLGMSEVEARHYRMHRDYCYNVVGLNRLERELEPPRMALDVGCGNGLNLEVLAERGWCGEGVDPHPGQVQALRQRGHAVEVADLERAAADPRRAGRYQLVTMLHVVEHLADPVPLVRSLRSLLGPGGVLLIETPLCCDLANQDHLFFFSGTSLHILLEKAGFTWDAHFMYVAHGYGHDNLLVLGRREG